MTIWRCVACWISKATRSQAHAKARPPTPTHARTEICKAYCFSMATMIAFPASMLRYTYIVSLVT